MFLNYTEKNGLEYVVRDGMVAGETQCSLLILFLLHYQKEISVKKRKEFNNNKRSFPFSSYHILLL